MAAVRTAARGLSTSDLERIKDGLGAGRKPRVVFTETAGQIAGQVGQIVRLTDPELGDEWVVVRFGQDELPFSPTDLIIAPKGAPARRPATGVARPGVAALGIGSDPVTTSRSRRATPGRTPSARATAANPSCTSRAISTARSRRPRRDRFSASRSASRRRRSAMRASAAEPSTASTTLADSG